MLRMSFPVWDKKAPFLGDQILFVMRGGEKLALPARVCLELCSGNGQWLVEKAKQHPEIFWIGVEKRIDRAKKMWKLAKRESAENVLVACGRAEIFVAEFLPEKSLEKVFVHFPDPWPKKRHAKHRIVQLGLLSNLKKAMKQGAEFCLVTDDQPFLLESMQTLAVELEPTLEFPHYVENDSQWGNSFFDQLWRQKARTIWRTNYAHRF